MKKEDDVLGISGSGYEYMKVPKEQESLKAKLIEFYNMRNFLAKIASSRTMAEFQNSDKKLKFINYGDTELVYVLSVGDKNYTMVVGQPVTEFGVVKREYDNLKNLGKDNRSIVIEPMQYFKDEEGKRELYVAPYVYQARSIGVLNGQWGVWVPDPKYHFKEFEPEESSVINSSMIALLVKLYNDKEKLGIGACKLGGGDFILEKGFEDEEITYENVLKRMKLTAARELLPMSLDEYVNKIKEEFQQRTYYKKESERDTSILINHKLRVPMTLEEIEKGIELGYALREREKSQTVK